MDKKNVMPQKQFANSMQAMSLAENTPRTNRESQKEAETWTDTELVDVVYTCGVFVEPIFIKPPPHANLSVAVKTQILLDFIQLAKESGLNMATWNDLILTPDGSLEVVERNDEDTVRINRPEGLSDTEYFWKARGECPSCRDGTSPVVMPGGWFECHRCKWRNG